MFQVTIEHSKFQANLEYMRPCLEVKKKLHVVVHMSNPSTSMERWKGDTGDYRLGACGATA